MGQSLAVGYAQAGASFIAVAARSITTETRDVVLEAARAAGRPPPEILSLDMDVCDKASVESATQVLEEKWGRLDILVTNSGYLATYAHFLDADEEEYARVWNVNYWGTFRVVKSFLPILLRGGDKTIVSVSSMAAQFVMLGGGAYHTSKLACARLIEFVQKEYEDQVGLLESSVKEPLTIEGHRGVLGPPWRRADEACRQSTQGGAV